MILRKGARGRKVFCVILIYSLSVHKKNDASNSVKSNIMLI